MSTIDIVFEQAKIIDRLTENNQKFSGPVRSVLPLLEQHQSVAEEETRLNEIGGV